MLKSIVNILFKGMLVVVPIGVTIYVLYWLGMSGEKLLAPLLQPLLPQEGILQYRTGMGVVAGLVLVFLVGLLTYFVLFRKVMEWVNRIFQRIPLVRSLYGGMRDLLDLLGQTSNRQRLAEVVSVSFGDAGQVIGFITQENSEKIPKDLAGDREDCVAVYLPMSYQIGGFTIFVSRSKLRKLSMSAENAIRYAFTAGMSTESTSIAEGSPKEEKKQVDFSENNNDEERDSS